MAAHGKTRKQAVQISHFLLSCDVLFQSKREIIDLSCTAVTDEDCWSLIFIAAVSVRRDETGIVSYPDRFRRPRVTQWRKMVGGRVGSGLRD